MVLPCAHLRGWGVRLRLLAMLLWLHGHTAAAPRPSLAANQGYPLPGGWRLQGPMGALRARSSRCRDRAGPAAWAHCHGAPDPALPLTKGRLLPCT